MQASLGDGIPGAAILSLYGPRDSLALRPDQAADFAEVARESDDDASVRAIVIDLRGLPAGPFVPSDPRSQPAAAIAAAATPTIAAITGDCFDQGLEAALACDVRVADTTARFAMRFVQHGRLPSDGGTQRLTRAAGRGGALCILLTGETVGAADALRMGLVDIAVEPGGFARAVEGLVENVVKAAPVAAMYAKEAVHAGADLALAQGLALEHDLGVLLHSTRDRAEGLRAFAERRSPEFEGR